MVESIYFVNEIICKNTKKAIYETLAYINKDNVGNKSLAEEMKKHTETARYIPALEDIYKDACDLLEKDTEIKAK